MAASLEQLAINTIRTLAMDAVRRPTAATPARRWPWRRSPTQLWNDVLRYDPAAPHWPNRDRFVLSCGHASMLLYSLLHLAGVQQLDATASRPTSWPSRSTTSSTSANCSSRSPGHPEHGHTAGVETTTGPLGQGCGNSVGMAIAERGWPRRFNRPGFELFDYNVYVAVQRRRPDGRRRQRSRVARRASEALEPLLDLRRQQHHDRRRHRTGVQRRCGHAVRRPRLERASKSPTPTIWPRSPTRIAAFRKHDDEPTLIIVEQIIGFGSPNKANTARRPRRAAGRGRNQAHQGSLRLARRAKFLVPAEVLTALPRAVRQLAAQRRMPAWEKLFADYAKQVPEPGGRAGT